MALEKIIDLPFKTGLTAKYLRVDGAAVDYRSGHIEIVIGVYADKASADEGRDPFNVHPIRLQGEAAAAILAELKTETGPKIYDLVKAQAAFAGAKKV